MADERHHNSGTGVGGQLPPWLRGVPLPARPSTDTSHPVESAVSASSDASALPDWLRALQPTEESDTYEDQPVDRASEPQTEATPNWLANLQTDPSEASLTTPEARDESTSDMPDWLRAISQEAEAETPQAPSKSSPSKPEQGSSGFQMPVGATDWLRSLGEEPSPASEPSAAAEPPISQSEQSERVDESIPAWLQNADVDDTSFDFDIGAAEPPQTAATPPSQDESIPAWLQNADTNDSDDTFNFDVAESTQAADTAAQDLELDSDKQGPSWLAPDTDEAPTPSDEGDIPAWLRDAAAPPAFDVNEELWESEDTSQSADSAPSYPAGPAEEPSLPSWLMDAQNSSQAEPASSGGQADDLPAWLQDSAPEDSIPSGSTAPTGGEELPAWLRDSEPSEPVSPSSSSAVRGEEDLPAWLRDSNVGSKEVTSPPSTPAADDLPPWLRDVDLSVDEPATASSQAPSTADDLPDWLKPDSPAASQSSSAAPAADDLPDWLKPDSAASQPSASADPSQTGDDLPDWLKTDGPAASQPSSAAPAADDLPDWLKPDSAASQPSASADPSQTGDDLPDWLKTDGPAASQPSSAAPAADDLPDWLKPDSAASQPSASADPSQTGDDLPDWLKTDSSAASAPSSAAPAADDLPGWLTPDSTEPASSAASHDADLPDWLRPSSGGASDASGFRSSSGDLPDWLQNESPSSATQGSGLPAWLQGAEPEARRSIEPPAQQSDSTLPPWLQDEEEQIEIVQGSEGPSGASGDFLGLGEDLPSWLSSNETNKTDQTEQAAGETYSDWLARLRAQQQEEEGEPEATPGVEETGAVSALKRPVYSVRPERVEAIALLNRLVAQPFTNPEVAVEPEPTKLKHSVIEKVCYALLLLALIASLAVPNITNSFQGGVAVPKIDQLISALDGLNENDVVLVGYEWDARRMGEMEALEHAVMDHLAEHRVKFVFVSTDLQGSLLASYQRNRLLNEFGYEPGGIDYLLLGYRPGGELALRQMAQNLREVLISSPLGEDVLESVVVAGMDDDDEPRLQSLSDFSAIIVLADEAQDVQSWFEQIRPAIANGQPMVFITPSEAAPIVQPYMRAENVYNLAGRQQALQYEQQRGSASSDEAATALGQLSFSIASFVALVVLGALINWIAAVIQRRRKA